MSADPVQQAAAVRRGAGLFWLRDRALLEVTGGDRVRWLDGMVSNDVQALAPGPERSGSYALLLQRTGRIVADLHVLLREEALWLELAAEAADTAVLHLEKYIVADDVRVDARGDELVRLALEGPAAADVLARAVGSPPGLSPDACAEQELAGTRLLVAAYGWSGEPAYQIFAPAAAGDDVAAALRDAGSGLGLVEAGPDTLEILRIENGTPRFGRELDDSVLPAEARLERAVSHTKGCYTGQEVVARMATRGQASHLLVGLHADGEPPAPGAELTADAQRVGEVTSSCLSPAAGAIALAFVRRGHAEAGTRLDAQGRSVRVEPLPFVAPGAQGG